MYEPIHKMLQKAADDYAHRKATLIDEHLFTFLREQAVTDARDVDSIRKALKEKRLDVTTEIKKTPTHEVYTFKLCRVFAESSLEIPTPEIYKYEAPTPQE